MDVKIVKFAAGLKIKGLICSSNYNHEEARKRVLEIECDTMPYSNLDFTGGLYS